MFGSYRLITASSLGSEEDDGLSCKQFDLFIVWIFTKSAVDIYSPQGTNPKLYSVTSIT